LAKEKTVKSKIARILDFVIPILTITIVIVGSVYIYKVNNEYSKAENEYAELETVANIEYPDEIELLSEDLDEEKEEVKPFFNLNIDFDALREVNPDVVGWIYIPILRLSYPVLYGQDNNYYLHHTVEDTPNFAGSIFIDSMCDPEIKGFNSFIYGHNMKNDSMFGSLSELKKHPEWIDGNPYIYYYTKDHAYRFRIFATYTTKVNSFVYLLSENRDQLSNYINKVQTVNQYENGKEIDLSTTKKIITLSTCSGTNTGNRTIVQAGIYQDYEY